MHPSKKAQIAYLKVNETLSKVSNKYTEFVDVFLPKLAMELFEYMEINNFAIDLENNWQFFYNHMYSLDSVELETLKTYIKNNLANGFIIPFKSSIRTPMLFDKKPDGSLQLYINYRSLNNLTI